MSYGTYIPYSRLKTKDIAEVWGKNPKDIITSLLVNEKSVPSIDEDSVTLALEAASSALSFCGTSKINIGALLVGSESHPYAVNPTSTVVGELLGIGNNYLASDLEFACKAGSAGIQMIAGLLNSQQIKYGLAIGTDTAQSKPHDVLEYTSGAGSAAFLLGSKKPAVSLLSYTSFSSDTPDFWRRDGIPFPSHAGRFSGEPAYFAHVIGAARLLMDKNKINIGKIKYCVFHMPNGKFPRNVAKRLGFSTEHLAPSLVVDNIGNPYSASSLLGLASVLDIASPGDLILMVSYGSGAGSDAFLWRVNKEILPIQKFRRKNLLFVSDQIKHKKYISYLEYLKQTKKL